MQIASGLDEITSLTEDGEALSYMSSTPATAGLPSLGSLDVVAGSQTTYWFAAYTTARHEKAVARQFDVRRIESFLPLYTTIRHWKNGCRVPVAQPLFPGYIFVHIGRREAIKVLQVPGVVSIVSAGREPSALSSSVVHAERPWRGEARRGTIRAASDRPGCSRESESCPG